MLNTLHRLFVVFSPPARSHRFPSRPQTMVGPQNTTTNTLDNNHKLGYTSYIELGIVPTNNKRHPRRMFCPLTTTSDNYLTPLTPATVEQTVRPDNWQPALSKVVDTQMLPSTSLLPQTSGKSIAVKVGNVQATHCPSAPVQPLAHFTIQNFVLFSVLL